MSEKPEPATEAAGHVRGLARTEDHSLADQWRYVSACYEDEHRHDAFLAACEAEGALPFADGCYAARLQGDPADPVALARRAQIERIRASAASAAAPPPPRRGRWRRFFGLG